MTQVSDDGENLKTKSREHEYVLQIDNKDHYFVIIEQEIIDYFQNVSGYFVILRDVTIAHNFETMILNAANTDALTQLYNRRYFEDFMKNNATRPMTLLYLDLDNFKDVNDKFGHRRGDEVLQRSAKFMQECFPGGIVSRMGGDEFTVILEQPISDEQIATACDVLNEKMKTLFRSGGLHVSVSVGVSKTDGSRSYDEILHEADERMYALKKERHAERE
jgi:diguanylate cyclase (GGDEF)-like protein